MADITVVSLRGGVNNTDPPTSLDSDQCTVAENVEFDIHPLGSRRNGCIAIDHPDLGDKVTFLFRHLPTNDQSEAELWALGVDGGTPLLKYKDTSWHTVTPDDAIIVSGDYSYRLDAVTLNNKLYVCYKSAVDRLHVWADGLLRTTGLAEPDPPTAADSGGGGSMIGTRYYRVRYIVHTGGGQTILRSEPSTSLTFSPSGSNAAVTVTKPASINEGETHWELEGSTDNNLFNLIARTPVGTTTVVDNTDFVTGYTGELSEDIGDYALLHSAEFVVADDNRLILAGSFEDEDLASRVAWTPVFNDPGVGNDERSPIDTDNYIDLNTSEGGGITAISRTVNGYIYVFKYSHIYQLTRSGLRSRAYDSHCLSKVRGAVRGSLAEGIDQQGRPCLYFIDPTVGPCRIGDEGVQTCSLDIQTTWRTVNVDATVVARALFYPDQGHTQQIHWWIATNDSETPDLRVMLQTNQTQQVADGVRRGWTLHTGPSSEAIAACLFSENIDDDTARSNVLRPFIGTMDGLILRCDTGNTDNGTAYTAHIVTAPIIARGILNRFGVRAGALVAKAAAGVSLAVSAIRNFGVETSTPISVSLTPTGVEDPVIRDLDSFRLFDCHALQVEFEDDGSGGQWHLDQFAMTKSDGEVA